MNIKIGLGQDSHAFEVNHQKPLILGGIIIDHPQGLKGNSDADVVLHSLTNSISSITGNNIIGSIADKLCKQGVSDSAEYLKLSLKDLKDYNIDHIAISIECLVPIISPYIDKIKSNIAKLTKTSPSDIGITVTTGEGLTEFGKGNGIQVLTIITVSKK